MEIYHEHPWQISTKKALEIQNKFRDRVILNNGLSLQSIRTIAAADVAYSKKTRRLFAAVALFSFPQIQFISGNAIEYPVTFPYVASFLSFRELPGLISIFKRIDENIDVILCDGHGIAHPRRFGLACHIGILLDKPSIGCAKSKLVGDYCEPGGEKGAFSFLYDHDEKIGFALRTKTNVKPLFISPAHKVNFDDCKLIVLNCLSKYRIPEPLRFAHQYANQLRMNSQN